MEPKIETENRKKEIKITHEKIGKVQKIKVLTEAINAVANYKTIEENAKKSAESLKDTKNDLSKTIDQQLILLNFEKDKIGYNDFFKRSQLEEQITQLESQKKNSETFTENEITKKEKDQEIVNQILKENYNLEDDLSGLDTERGLSPLIPVQVSEKKDSPVEAVEQPIIEHPEIIKTPFAITSTQNAEIFNTPQEALNIHQRQKPQRIAREATQAKVRKNQELSQKINSRIQPDPRNFARVFPIATTPEAIPQPSKNPEVEAKSQTIEGLSTEERIKTLEKLAAEKLANNKPNEARYYNILLESLKSARKEPVLTENVKLGEQESQLVKKSVSKKSWINGILEKFKKKENTITDTRELERVEFDKKTKEIDRQILNLKNLMTYTENPEELEPINQEIAELEIEQKIVETQEKIRKIENDIKEWEVKKIETDDEKRRQEIDEVVKELISEKIELQRSLESKSIDQTLTID